MPVKPHSVYSEYLAANVKRLRAKQGLTQEALAELADIGMRFMQRIESGRTNIGLNAIVALAEALEVKPSALFNVAKLTRGGPGRPKKR